MNSLIMDLQNNLKSKETIIERLNFQIESMNSQVGFDFAKNGLEWSQKNLDLSKQEIEFKDSLGQIEGFSKDIDILKSEKR